MFSYGQGNLRVLCGFDGQVTYCYGADFSGDGLEGQFVKCDTCSNPDDSMNYIRPACGIGAWARTNILRLNAPIRITSTSTIETRAMETDVEVDATGGNITLTLSQWKKGQTVNVIRYDNTSNTVNVKTSTGTINGFSEVPLPDLQRVYSISLYKTNSLIK